MARVTKTIGFSVPPPVRKEVEQIAKAERRTKSELFREMVRVYRRYRLQRDRDEERWVQTLIDETKAEEARKPISRGGGLRVVLAINKWCALGCGNLSMTWQNFDYNQLLPIPYPTPFSLLCSSYFFVERKKARREAKKFLSIVIRCRCADLPSTNRSA